MGSKITQNEAKLLVEDYLRETGRKGTSEFMKTLGLFTKYELFTKRTLDDWRRTPGRNLNTINWKILLEYLESDYFRDVVRWSRPCNVDRNLIDAVLSSGLKGEPPEDIRRERDEFMGEHFLNDIQGYWKVESRINSDELDSFKNNKDCYDIFIKLSRHKTMRIGKIVILYLDGYTLDIVTGFFCIANNWRSEKYQDLSYSGYYWRRKNPKDDHAFFFSVTGFNKKENLDQAAEIDFIANELLFYKIPPKDAVENRAIRLLNLKDGVKDVLDYAIDNVVPHHEN